MLNGLLYRISLLAKGKGSSREGSFGFMIQLLRVGMEKQATGGMRMSLSQAETDRMLNESIISLTGEKTEKKAWTALFRHFNSKHGRKNQSYKPGEKIAVKINTNNTYSHEDSPELNASPQLVLSLLKSLVT